MVIDGLLEDIVETYELPDRLKQRIIGIATRRIRELGVSSFDSVYRYIDSLVEKFTSPYEERFVRRLDSPIRPDSRTPLHELIGTEDRDLVAIVEDEENEDKMPKELSLPEALDILERHLDERSLSFLNQLAACNGNRSFPLNVSPEELVVNAAQLQGRLQELANRYERDGTLVLPPRPIVAVRFDPSLKIKFGPRYYHGNPLAFFMEHRETYDGMARAKFKKFDRGLYRSLLSHGQLADAIPGILPHYRPRLTPQQIAQIVNSYGPSGRNASEAARHGPYSSNTYLKHWREAGLEIGQPDGSWSRFTPQQIAEIIDSYGPSGGKALEAARHGPYSVNTYLKYWIEGGLEIRLPGRPQREANVPKPTTAISERPIEERAVRYITIYKNGFESNEREPLEDGVVYSFSNVGGMAWHNLNYKEKALVMSNGTMNGSNGVKKAELVYSYANNLRPFISSQN